MRLFHHGYRVSNRAEARVFARIRDDRFLIHLRDEWKKDLLFLLDMRMHLAVKFLSQLGDSCQLGRLIDAFCRCLRSHFSEPWKLLADRVMMDAYDVLNQAAQRQIRWI